MFLLRKFFVGLLALSLVCAPVSAQVAQTGGGLPTPAGDLTNTDNACLAVSGTVQTFTAKKLGGGQSGRILVVSINWSDSTLAGTAEISGVTVDGNAMTRAVRAAGDNQNSNSEIWYAQVSNGATGDVVVTSSTAIDGMTIGIYRLVNYTLTVPFTTATGTTTATVNSLLTGFATLASASRRVDISTSLSNITNNYSTDCGSFLWGVHASNFASASGNITTTISPTTDTPLIAVATWQPGTAPAPLDGTSPTGAWSASRQLVSSYGGSFYTIATGVSSWNDQSGNARNFTQITGSAQPTITTVGTNSRNALHCDGVNDVMDAPAISNFITASTGYLVVTFIPREVVNQVNIYDNLAGFADTVARIGVFIDNNQLQAFNWDGSADVPTAVTTSINNVYTVSWRHEGGVLYQIVNGGTENSVSSGDTSSLTPLLRICASRTTGAEFSLLDILELVSYTTIPSAPTRAAIEANFKAWGGSYLLDPANDNTPMFLNKAA